MGDLFTLINQEDSSVKKNESLATYTTLGFLDYTFGQGGLSCLTKCFFLDNANLIKVIPKGYDSNQYNLVLEKLNWEDWSVFFFFFLKHSAGLLYSLAETKRSCYYLHGTNTGQKICDFCI